MDFSLSSVFNNVAIYEYIGLFLITYLSAAALPVPAGPSLITAAVLASQGYLNITWVFTAAVLGNILGDQSAYWVSRLLGVPVLHKLGFRKVITSDTYKLIDKKITLYRWPIVFLSRFQSVATISVNILAGLTRLPYWSFFVISIFGEALGVLVFAGIGYYFGTSWQTLYDVFGKLIFIIIAVFLVLSLLASKQVSSKILNK
jgi:membrane protein DedA with SNARE-associated domain